MEHVPKSVRADWGALLLHLLRSFLVSRSKRDFQLLWMAPKCILGPLKRAGIHHAGKSLATLRRRLQQWHTGQFAALWAEVRAVSSRQAGTQPKPETMEDDSEDSELDPNLIRRVQGWQ